MNLVPTPPNKCKKPLRNYNKQKASAFVLDLRGNPGGLLFASVDIARMWMSEGEIVDIVDRRGGHQNFLLIILRLLIYL